IREYTPDGYFDSEEEVGSLGGVHSANDEFTQIVTLSGDHGVHYDFCEVPGGKISGYVFQDGPPIEILPGQSQPDPETIRDGKRTADDTPIAGVRIFLYNAKGEPILDTQGNQRSTRTDANGYYEFTNLPAGLYLVREVQPDGYFDSLDTPGTTGGLAVNHKTPTDAIFDIRFANTFDVIAKFSLAIAGDSRENNFSEVVYSTTPIIPPIPIINLPIPPVFSATGIPTIFPELEALGPLRLYPRTNLDGSDGLNYTWHLSIVDAGYPRGTVPQTMAMTPVSISAPAWSQFSFTGGQWILQNADGTQTRRETIGMRNAIALAGDFNGDGVMELGLYINGQWFIDFNGNGKWDAGDLWAKLGTRDDKPVVGDWDGDGKDDIGIYGPAWARDPIAVQADPGLPDPLNPITGKKKNPPPEEDEAALGKRKLQRGSTGPVREDLIDHVFHYGTPLDHPVVGDWTGDGLRRIGIFYNGQWHLDIDADGRFGPSDVTATFGQKGDVPVVGDWNGDGIERLGVFRDGTWILDTNGNNVIDGQDKVVHLGASGDQPVAGDWNGDGRDEVGVYHPASDQPNANDAVAQTPADEANDTAVE
ncbi:MAG: fibrinogen-binding protein, partial [Pirellulales bacterium]|nr:fibrinogen-binding protein [Pirellulales bacterium]